MSLGCQMGKGGKTKFILFEELAKGIEEGNSYRIKKFGWSNYGDIRVMLTRHQTVAYIAAPVQVPAHLEAEARDLFMSRVNARPSARDGRGRGDYAGDCSGLGQRTRCIPPANNTRWPASASKDRGAERWGDRGVSGTLEGGQPHTVGGWPPYKSYRCAGQKEQLGTEPPLDRAHFSGSYQWRQGGPGHGVQDPPRRGHGGPGPQ
ncbi:unnamed protein product [Arctogadus glacialis]